jgi:hypothetical protein
MVDEYNDEKFVDEGEMNVYKKKSRDELMENDEISPEEEAFMDGYYDDEDDDK